MTRVGQLPHRRRADARRPLLLDGVAPAGAQRHPDRRRCAPAGSCRSSRCPARRAASRWTRERRSPTSPASPTRPHATSSGPALPGRQGDVIHVFRYAQAGTRDRDGRDPGPAAERRADPAELPAHDTRARSVLARPARGLARRHDPARAAQPRRRRRDRRHRQQGSVRYVATGPFPYGAAILPRRAAPAWCRNETPGTVSVIDLRPGRRRKDIQVGAHLSHPEAIALDPQRGPRLRRDRQRRPGRRHRHQAARGRAHAVGRARRRASAPRRSRSR